MADERLRDGSSTPADDALMARVVQGDHAAYALLVNRHVDRMYALARRMLGRPAEAEEMVQEAFLRVWTHGGQWSAQKGGFATWLGRIVVNLCIDRMRRGDKDHEGLDDAAALADPSVDLEADLHRQQVGRRVALEVGRLPPRQRAALALCHYGGVSNGEAAEILGVSVGAVEALLVRARRTLAQRLESWVRS